MYGSIKMRASILIAEDDVSEFIVLFVILFSL